MRDEFIGFIGFVEFIESERVAAGKPLPQKLVSNREP
jgi:hypothetical protein